MRDRCHSAQIALAHMVMYGMSDDVEHVSCFNGIGVKFGKLLFLTKNDG